MPILAHDANRGVFSHQCVNCGHERRDLPIDPVEGHVTIHEECLVLSPCPACAARGQTAIEMLRLHIPAWEARESEQTDSLVGTVFPDTGGVVVEHTVGYHLTDEHIQQARLIRALQRHPSIQAHRPLKDESARTGTN